ncbi:hypothetical protein EV421DRAFT_1742696 [Armillaria borealis]|uniref:Uncharacterized protein n=1 Tax=Armillaria borealis TaxID=47425 RepID=A0AA39MF46_9AGAR|nr:hypothetical protein EV421DRAFT_1742696 [Armillaria borealis]
MYKPSRPCSPPPSYRSSPNDETARVDERTPLKVHIQATPTKRLRIILGLIFIVAFLAFHIVSDYTNTHRTDFQDRMRRREDAERAKRFKDEDEQRKHAHQQEDRERRAAHQEEDQRKLSGPKRMQSMADEERRKRAGLVWWDLTPEKRCVGYEKRMYHAELLNVPAEEDAQSWCMRTSIDIHGITYDHPELCTHEVVDGAVKTIGHWTVSSNEPTCKTWWGNHQKKDCYGSHKRRVDAKMFNHQEPWDNWAEMCFSTPSQFAWQAFAHPDTCENKGKEGIVGSWFIDVDENECP